MLHRALSRGPNLNSDSQRCPYFRLQCALVALVGDKDIVTCKRIYEWVTFQDPGSTGTQKVACLPVSLYDLSDLEFAHSDTVFRSIGLWSKYEHRVASATDMRQDVRELLMSYCRQVISTITLGARRFISRVAHKDTLLPFPGPDMGRQEYLDFIQLCCSPPSFLL